MCTFKEVTENKDGSKFEAGQLRLMMLDTNSAGSLGSTYQPSSAYMAEASGTANYYVGDIYINNEPSTCTFRLSTSAYGKNAYLTVIHEIGHAMGLDHPFDETANWSTKRYEAFPETVMSYFWYKGIRKS